MDDVQRVLAMSDETVQDIWDAIWELEAWQRPNEEWSELIYSEITRRGLRSGRKPVEDSVEDP